MSLRHALMLMFVGYGLAVSPIQTVRASALEIQEKAAFTFESQDQDEETKGIGDSPGVVAAAELEKGEESYWNSIKDSDNPANK